MFTDVFRYRPLLCTIHHVSNSTPVSVEQHYRAVRTMTIARMAGVKRLARLLDLIDRKGF